MSASLELSVIAPCFNEVHNVAELTRRVLATFERGAIPGELILINDCSADATGSAIDALAAAHPGRVVALHHERNRGIAEAWRTGARAARGRLAAIIDSDLQYQPEDLLRMYRTLGDTAVDVVQGKRSAVGRARDARFHLSRGLNTLLNLAFGMRLYDNKSGFLMCAREVLDDLLTYQGRYRYWQSFIMVAAHAKGYSYKEIETLFESRKQGRSFLEGKALRVAFRALFDIPIALWEYRLAARYQDVSEQYLRRHPTVDRTPQSLATGTLRWRAYMATFKRTHWMITRDVERYYKTLRATQWLSPAELRELQDEKLRRLVRHAYRNVPYYRIRMQAAGLRPEDIRGQVDLKLLPFLTKDDVRRNLYFDILSENHDKHEMLRISTSGSTGEPFVVYVDRAQLEFRWAATLRAQEWTGYRFGDPCLRLWHQTIGMTRDQIRKERADAWFNRRKFVPVFKMRKDGLENMARAIADWRPVLMDGYAEALDLLAHHVRESGRIDARPRAIMSSAQSLPPASRKIIEEAFGCRVFDKYGAREFSGIAYECEAHAGHHVVGEGYIVEILRDGQPVAPGEIGEIVITDLNNYCLPFIR
ncbi:MAG: glycosyltransferase, partial [Vicinamibacteria bacterium]|nr:glycosyltransferase [Vicinamibacteria bacterium]